MLKQKSRRSTSRTGGAVCKCAYVRVRLRSILPTVSCYRGCTACSIPRPPIPGIWYANLSPGPHKFSIHFLFSAKARTITNIGRTEREGKNVEGRREKRAGAGQKNSKEQTMGTGARYLKYTGTYSRAPFFPRFRLRLATLVPRLVAEKRIHDSREEEGAKLGVSFLVLFIVCVRVACNGQRCVETGSPRAVPDFADGDANWLASPCSWIFVRG